MLAVFLLAATPVRAQVVQELAVVGSDGEFGLDSNRNVISDILATLGLPAWLEPCYNPLVSCVQAAFAGELGRRNKNAVLVARGSINPLVLAMEGDVAPKGVATEPPLVGAISLTDSIFNNAGGNLTFRTGKLTSIAATTTGVIFDTDVYTLFGTGLCVPCVYPRVQVSLTGGITSFNPTAFLSGGAALLYPPFPFGSGPVLEVLPISTSTTVTPFPPPPPGARVTHLSQNGLATLQAGSDWSVYRCCEGFIDRILASGDTVTDSIDSALKVTFRSGNPPVIGTNGGFFATVDLAVGTAAATQSNVVAVLGTQGAASQANAGAVTLLRAHPRDGFGDGSPGSAPVVSGDRNNRTAAAWLRRSADGSGASIERVLSSTGILTGAAPVTVANTTVTGDGWVSFLDPVAVLDGGAVLVRGEYRQSGLQGNPVISKRVAWVDGIDTLLLPLGRRDAQGNPIPDSTCLNCNVEVSPVAFEASNSAGGVVYRVTGPQQILGIDSIPSQWRAGGDESFLNRANWLLGVGPLDRPVGNLNRKIVFDAPTGAVQAATLRIGANAGPGYQQSAFLDTLTVGGVGDRAGSAWLVVEPTSAPGDFVSAPSDLQVGTTIDILANGTMKVCSRATVFVGTPGSNGAPDVLGTVTVHPGGALYGDAQFNVNVTGAGAINPGCSPGTMKISGTFTQEAGDLNFEIGGTAEGQYDVLDVSGETKLLGGIVRVTFINGFTPKAGDTFGLFRARGGLTIDPSVQYVFTNAPAGFKLAFDATGAVTVASATTGPDVTPNISGTLGTNGWYTSDVTLTWTVTDAAATVTSTSGCDTASITADTAGTSFTCTATSAGGTTTKSVTVKRDATAPLAQATALPVPNGAGWNNTDVVVHLSATEATSGPAVCAADQTLTAEGANQSSAAGTCKDQAGNVSSPVTVTGINIDKTPPTILASRSPIAGAGGWSNLPVTVSFTATDALSTVAASGCTPPVTFSTDGVGLSASGTCSDLAGNSASTTLGDIKIDRTPPGVAAVATPGPNANGWNNTDVTVSFAGTESLSGSGVASCSANVLLSAEGAAQPASGTCTDVAGNTSPARSIVVNIDKTVPSATIAVPNGGTYTQGAVVNASYVCSDPLSSIANCTGTVGNGTPVDTASAGVKSFVVTATDRAGNSSSAQASYTVTAVTASLPVITPVISGTLGANNWYTSNVSLSWTVTSSAALTSRSGCNARNITSNTAGVTFTCTAANASGTTSQSVTIKRDANPPVTRANATPNANGAGWRRSAVTVSFTGVDNVSGIATCSPATQLTAEGPGQSASGQCTNGAGLSSTATRGDINIDLTPPEVAISTPTSGAVYARNTVVLASFACSDSLSGIPARNGCTGSVPNGSAINTRERGVRTLTVTGRDEAGNATTRSVSYTVQ